MMSTPSSAFSIFPAPAPVTPGFKNETRLWALLPCAGTGSRATAGTATGTTLGSTAALSTTATLAKQYHIIAGQPMVGHTLAAFAGVGRLLGTVVAIAPDDDFWDTYAWPLGVATAHVARCGGATRAQSVLGGLDVLTQRGALDDDWVLVHDAARCLVTSEQIDHLIDVCQHDAVGGLLAHKLPDTLKTATDGPGGVRVVATLDRSDKWLAQTPQMFRIGMLREALQQLGPAATDEASAIEAKGLRPRLVPGGAHNFKVTYPEDFALAAAVLAQRAHSATLDRFAGLRGQGVSSTDRKGLY